MKVLDNIKDGIPRKPNKIRGKSKLDKTEVEKLKKSNRIGKWKIVDITKDKNLTRFIKN